MELSLRNEWTLTTLFGKDIKMVKVPLSAIKKNCRLYNNISLPIVFIANVYLENYAPHKTEAHCLHGFQIGINMCKVVSMILHSS